MLYDPIVVAITILVYGTIATRSHYVDVGAGIRIGSVSPVISGSAYRDAIAIVSCWVGRGVSALVTIAGRTNNGNAMIIRIGHSLL